MIQIFRNTLKITCFIVLSGLLFVSCKDYVEEVRETITSAEDNAVAETEFSSLYDIVDDFVSLNMLQTYLMPAGTKILLRDTTFLDGDGWEFSIYFGEMDSSVTPRGRLCYDGKYRAGLILVSVTNPSSTIGSVITIETCDKSCYYSGNGEDMFQVEGKLTITRTGSKNVNIKVEDAVIKDKDYEFSWECDRQVEITYDAGPGIWRDTYEITGSAEGVNRLGEKYKVSILEPLIKTIEIDCASSYNKGVLQIDIPENKKKIFVDYDPYKDEACDQIAEAEINGKRTIFKVK